MSRNTCPNIRANMSHKATNWAIQQKGLKPATKILLWHLADCHNPSHGCFPSQKYLSREAEMAVRSVRDHLVKLEEIGLIERVKMPVDGGFDRTEYTLKLDVIYNPPAKSAAGENEYIPPAKSAAPHRQNLPTNLVSNNPVKEPCASDDAHTKDFDLFYEEFKRSYPRMGDEEKTEDALREAIDEGAKPQDILAGAKAYDKENAENKIQYLKFSENWIADKRWRQHVVKPRSEVDPAKIIEARAKTILEAKPFLCRSITAHAAGECISAGLVTVQQCRDAGIQI